MSVSEAKEDVPELAQNAVLVQSEPMPTDAIVIKGYEFKGELDYHKLLQSYICSGFQATCFGQAIEEVKRMIKWRLSDQPYNPQLDDEELEDIKLREQVRCTIFLGFTSNLISSGVRETLCYLARNKMVDAMVSSAGGVEEDFIKCLAPTYVGDFHLKGRDLRLKGQNRIGNLIVPNENYCKFEDWMMPILDKLLEEQESQGINWTPSKIIHRLGKEINHPESVYYWAYRNNIPVFCPALTDGSLGDMIYFHSYKNPGLRVDIAEDIRGINSIAVKAKQSGMIILGGGVVKHHICNANLMRNGADYSVFINTGNDFDGSDAGAKPDEAISWGKIKIDAKPVKVTAEATLVFPLLVAETFKQHWEPKADVHKE